MALFRALSTRSRRGGYDRLLDETNTLSVNDHGGGGGGTDTYQAVLKRVTSVPASMLFGSSKKKLDHETGFLGRNSKPKQQQPPAKSKKGGKSHPVFSLFEGKWRKKKVTANPDFSRYIEYLKEGGMWNKDTNSAAIYYK